MVTDEIRSIAKKLEQCINPQKIFLFGSFARGDEREDSDYDFYLMMPDSVQDCLSISQNAYQALRGLRKRPVDIVVGSVSTFEERKRRKTLENIIAKEGIVLYEK